jgi:FMN phosphatase YigB (HAD superfamily)
LAFLGASADEAFFVDDDVAYCRGAMALGVRAALIDRSGPDATTGQGSVPVVRSFLDLASLLTSVP